MGLEKLNKILVFRALQLGDLLVTVPAFRALRNAFPSAEITLVGLPWAADFVSHFGSYLDRFIEFPGYPGLPERALNVREFPHFLAQIQNEQFDLAIQMQGSGIISNPLVSLFGAKKLAGYYLPGQFCPNASTFLPYTEEETENRAYLRLVKHIGAPPQGEWLEFPIFEVNIQNASLLKKQVGLDGEGYVCLHPGARLPEKRWPAGYFAALGDAVYQMGYRILVTGTTAEKVLAQEVIAGMTCPAANLAGETSLGDLGALLAGASLLISNDTGVSHLADALGVPSVILFISTSPERWGPEDQELHRCVPNALEKTPVDILPLIEDVLVNGPLAYKNRAASQPKVHLAVGQKETI